uniref:Uncharacterized protein n=1 Tax=Ditylenchus dipsaci TaxID=166011 RepID=A0A915DQ24_9BILA
MASRSFESDSGERASTTDDVESSQWTTDCDDSESGNRNGHESDSDDSTSSACKNDFVSRKKNSKINGKRVAVENSEKTQVQSDTETRNLLDDVGEDFDEDFLDLQEAGSLNTLDNQLQSVEIDPKLFELSPEQHDYYSKCFLHLLDKTQGTPSINGALNGSDGRLIEFFRKSQLDDRTLSRIWALSDVNEDGFLNHSEFIVAMHLIILHTKGNVPIPSKLPSLIRPSITPVRHLTRLKTGCFTTTTTAVGGEGYSTTTSSNTTNVESDNSSRTSNLQDFANGNLDHADGNVGGFTGYSAVNANGGAKQHSLSDDHLHVYAANREVGVAKFSDVPPVLVDSHPTALNATTSSVGFKTPINYNFPNATLRGPPPQPPARNYTDKGHGRSASLDLKTFVALSSYPPKSPHLNVHLPGANLLSSETDKSTPLNMPQSVVGEEQFVMHPKLSSVVMHNRATQTETIRVWPKTLDFSKIDYEETICFVSNESQELRLSGDERCKVLRKLNDELENERVTLAQVRLQLQLRVDEAQEQLKSLNMSSRTSVHRPEHSNDSTVLPIKPTTI